MIYINIDSNTTPTIDLDELAILNHNSFADPVFAIKLVEGPGVTLTCSKTIDGAATRMITIPFESLLLRRDELGYWWVY